MIVYLAVPFVFAGLIPLSTLIKKEAIRNLLCSLIPALILFAMLGLKGASVGVDSQTYISAYYDLRSIPRFPNPEFFESLKSYNFQNEYGFILFAQLFSMMGLPYLVFQLFSYGIICFCLFFSTWKLSKNPIASFIIFFCFTFFNFFVSGLRQSFAVSLCLLAISIVSDGGRTPVRSIIYFFLIGLATFWHKSAFIFIVPYFLLGIKVGTKSMLVLVFASIFLFVFGAEMYEFINTYVSFTFGGNYGDYAPFSFGKGLTSLLLIAIIAVSYLLFKPSKVKNVIDEFICKRISFYANGRDKSEVTIQNDVGNLKEDKLFSLLIILAFIGTWLSYTSRFSIAFGRISMYFTIMIIFLLPNSVEKIKNARIKYTIYIMLFTAFVLYFVYTALLPNYLGIIPYTVIEGTL